jgi:hypothetical protein
MKAVLRRQYSFADLESRLRQVPVMGSGDLIYEHAKIESLLLEPKEITVAQNYVLSDQVDLILSLWRALKPYGVNIFDLPGFAQYESEDGLRDVLPPVVEQSEVDGVRHLLCDGAHRVSAIIQAKRRGLVRDSRIRVVFISNIPSRPDFQYYALPHEGGWNSVEYVKGDKKPAAGKKYRLKDYRSQFRDFNVPFQGVTTKRQSRGQ